MEKKQQNVAEEMVKLLEKKKADYLSLTQNSLSAGMKNQLGLSAKPTHAEIGKALEPHLGEGLRVKYVNAKKTYLVSGKSDEDLLFGILQKHGGKGPGINNLPFKKDEYVDALNRLSDQGRIRVKFKLSSDKISPLIFRLEGPVPGPADPGPRPEVSEENFKAAYQTLGRGRVQVRICEMRRHLGWSVPDFNKILIGLRDAEEIDLQGGDTDFYTDEDIRDSFVDENGFRKLNIMWRQ